MRKYCLGATVVAAGLMWATAADVRVPTNVAYVSNESGAITVIDLASLAVKARMDAGDARPRGLALTPDGRYLVTANKETADASVFDTATLRHVKRIHIGSNPEFLKLHPGGALLFTSYEPGSTGGPPKAPSPARSKYGYDTPPSRIVALNVRDWSTAHTFTSGSETEGVEFSRDGKQLLVTNEAEDSFTVFDIARGTTVQTVSVTRWGARPRGIKISPDGSRYAVTLEASSKLLLFDHVRRLLRSTQTAEGPYGVAFDRAGRRIFVAAARAQKLQVFDASSLALLGEAPVGRRCWHFTFTPDDSKILIACGRSDEVRVIDARTYQPIRTLKDIPMPWGIVTWPRAYGSLDLP